MQNNALIGYTGFIGQNLKNQMDFSFFYNSKNISEIRNKEFDLVVSSGNSSTRWLVNKNPKEDLDNIISFIENIKTIKAKKIVLLSTIDVYQNPYDVTEDSSIDSINENSYGHNRFFLEKAIRDIFSSCLIVRLPIVYGHGFKKNVIFDALNNNEICKINGEALVQIYNVKNLGKDLEKFIDVDCRLVNLATEPLLVRDLYRDIFDIELNNGIKSFFKNDFQTKHCDLTNNQKYFYNKSQIVEELRVFKEEYESKRI
jgi:nucleoside-diphosphate-sugar epimerase